MVATKITVVSDEHQNCVGGGVNFDIAKWKRENVGLAKDTNCKWYHFHVQIPRENLFILLGLLLYDLVKNMELRFKTNGIVA